MALAKLPRGKIKSYNDYGQDFFIFSFFSLHDAKKKLWAFSKKIFAYQNFQKKEEKATKREKKSFIHFFSNARNSGFRKKYE
jgi:hypothetical protein